MTLKFKRNIPIVLLLVSILSLFVLTLGNQPIASYTVNMGALPPAQISNLLANVVSGWIH